MKSPSNREEKPRRRQCPHPLRFQLRHLQINLRLRRNPQRRRQPSQSRFPPKPDVSPLNAVSISPTSTVLALAEKSSLPTFSPLRNPKLSRRPPQLTAAARRR